jgi:hypothetical protein
LKLEKNIYGQKQAGRVWNSFLMDKAHVPWIHTFLNRQLHLFP